MESPLTLGADLGLAFYLAIGITYAVQGIKWFLEALPTTRTNNLPDWLWVPISLAVSVAVCWVMKEDGLLSLIKLDLSPPMSYIATGLGIGFSSNVIYAVTKPLRKKLKVDGKVVCLPAGVPLPTTTTTETTDEATTTTTTTAPVPNIPNIPINSGQESQQMSTDAGNSIRQTVSENQQIPLDSTSRLVDQSANGCLYTLTPVESEEPVWLTGPTDTAPSHVMIPAGWR